MHAKTVEPRHSFQKTVGRLNAAAQSVFISKLRCLFLAPTIDQPHLLRFNRHRIPARPKSNGALLQQRTRGTHVRMLQDIDLLPPYSKRFPVRVVNPGQSN